ncbi:snaclec agkicetin-C subunit beta-like [Cheilinus undulatus]|uniref:snaclec agkicetin-C subunit beta-like n=1 Tax=Cheilinus undulatus TaxID=241271 RepID=UPI001BD6C32D|nr:snaclec agkicetin-C subunit beta-like [Cheilinus undulatus]
MEAVLVKENKTWEEALEYCRDRQSDLVSLMFEAAQKEVLKISNNSQTAQVWTGLRNLADSWLWVDGEKMMYQAWKGDEMPRCPALRHRCGALLPKEGRWESWDCTKKLNFVCHKFGGGN